MDLSKKHLKSVFKLLVGFALIYYVFQSKMVNFGALREVVFQPFNLIISIGILSFMAVCVATRWYFLTRAQGLSISYKDLISLTMIGNFFNTFMPGSVGGDVIKAWYVAGREPLRRTKAVFTVLLDRSVGLWAIIFYAAATLVLNLELLDLSHELKLVALSLWGFIGATMLFGVLFFIFRNHKRAWMERFMTLAHRVRPIGKIMDALVLYRHHPGAILKAVCLSLLSFFSMIMLFMVQGKALGIELEPALYFFVIPLGMTVSAIPLLPGGIGVGQVAFYNLFKMVGMSNPDEGSTLCTLMQFYVILFNCLGAVFYMKFKRKPSTVSVDSDSAFSIPQQSAKYST